MTFPRTGAIVELCRFGHVERLSTTSWRGIGIGENAGLKRRCGDGGVIGEVGNEAVALVVEEEERLVLDDGTAKRRAVKVADIRVLRQHHAGVGVDRMVEEVARAERVPAAEVKGVAVKVVGATARDYIDDG